MKDMFRKMITITMAQVSNIDTYAQVSMKEGNKSHGHKALDAAFKEFVQVGGKNIFDLQDVKVL